MKPRLHRFRGRWYCVGNGVGHGKTPELAYYSWRDAHVGQFFNADRCYPRPACDSGFEFYMRQQEQQPIGYYDQQDNHVISYTTA